MDDWRITFVDTGLHSNIGERLPRIRKYLQDEPMFLANYSDQLSNLSLDSFLNDFTQTNTSVGFISVKPSSQSYHNVEFDDDGFVKRLKPIAEAEYWVNGGYFAMRQDTFDYINEGEDIVEEPFERMAAEKKLWTHEYSGFWKAMDTFKDKITYDRMWGHEETPWCVWNGDDAWSG